MEKYQQIVDQMIAFPNIFKLLLEQPPSQRLKAPIVGTHPRMENLQINSLDCLSGKKKRVHYAQVDMLVGGLNHSEKY